MHLLPIIALALLLAACDSGGPDKEPHADGNTPHTVRPAPAEDTSRHVNAPETADPAIHDIMNQSIILQRFESIAEALPVWRQFADSQPTLLLFTDSPQLVRPPAELMEPIDILAGTGAAGAIRSASRKSNPSALLHPAMSVDIALRNRWFGRLAWVFPLNGPEDSIDIELVRSQLAERGMLEEQEAVTLALKGQGMTGTVRGLPLTASDLSRLPPIDGPVVVHIDLAYFQSLYKNEIATPLLQTLYGTLSALKDRHLQALAVTFSYGHVDNQIALDVRFVGEILQALLDRPELLQQPIPDNWRHQADILYLANFFQSEQIGTLAKGQEQVDPDSAWVKFNLYRAAASQKQGDQALGYLAEAVARDPMYAYEYGNLARMAYERRRPDETMRMLSLAATTFPDDPFIKLRMAELAAELGDRQTARHLAEQLRALPWSPHYHAWVPDHLARLLNDLDKQ